MGTVSRANFARSPQLWKLRKKLIECLSTGSFDDAIGRDQGCQRSLGITQPMQNRHRVKLQTQLSEDLLGVILWTAG